MPEYTAHLSNHSPLPGIKKLILNPFSSNKPWLDFSIPYTAVRDGIIKAIEANDDQLLYNYLTTRIECSRLCTILSRTYVTTDPILGPVGPSYTTPAQATVVYRTLIDWLFYEKKAQADLMMIIQKIIDNNNPHIHQKFKDSLSKTDFKDMQDKLFCWNEESKDNVVGAINEMDKYMQLLKQNNVNKGQIASGVIEQLRQRISDYENLSEKTDFSNLKFKLELKYLLHSQDDVLCEYRGWGRFVVNLLTILFTLTIANWCNLGVTGNFLFFNEVKTKQLLENVDDKLGASPGVQPN